MKSHQIMSINKKREFIKKKEPDRNSRDDNYNRWSEKFTRGIHKRSEHSEAFINSKTALLNYPLQGAEREKWWKVRHTSDLWEIMSISAHTKSVSERKKIKKGTEKIFKDTVAKTI